MNDKYASKYLREDASDYSSNNIFIEFERNSLTPRFWEKTLIPILKSKY